MTIRWLDGSKQLRLLTLLLAVAMLWGCQSHRAAPETTAPMPATAPPQEFAQRISGQMDAYALPVADALGIAPMEDRLLILSGKRNTVLTAVDGRTMEILARRELDCSIDQFGRATQVSQSGICYYNSNAHQLVFLNPQLEETECLSIPEGCDSSPVVSEDLQTVCYAVGSEIRLLDRGSGMDRRIRTMEGDFALTALHSCGTLLQCSLFDDGVTALFLSTEDGSTQYTVSGETALYIGKETYYLTHMDGIYPEKLTGKIGQSPMQLIGAGMEAGIYPLPALDAVVLADRKENAKLCYYRLSDGIMAYRLSLPENLQVRDLCTGADAQVWVLCCDSVSAQDVLVRWRLDDTATNGSESCLHSRCTSDSPDPETFARCCAQAAALEEAYGVRILLWEDAAAADGAYRLQPEYQTELIEACLSRLDFAFSLFPGEILRQSALSVGLVRSIQGCPSEGTLGHASGLTTWDGAGNPCILLCPGCGVEYAFCHELSHAIDTRVLCTSGSYDNWCSLNPDGFVYDYDYIANQSRNPEHYLEEGNRCFIDCYAMSFPTEDRARILEYAVQPEMAPYFSSDVMQRKLLCISTAIRQAFALTGEPGSYLWEQYLNNENPEQVS